MENKDIKTKGNKANYIIGQHHNHQSLRKPELVILPSAFDSRLSLPMALGLRAGFPSPAEQYETESIDFNKDFVMHPDTTFYARVIGDSMIDVGINEGDIVVVDRSLEPHKGDIVVGYINEAFTIKYFDDSHKEEGYIELVPANKKYPHIKVTPADEFTLWGVVQYSIKNWHK
ncbi:MAG: LexA family protein [Prevotella sp.]